METVTDLAMNPHLYQYGVKPKAGDMVKIVPHKTSGFVEVVSRLDATTIVHVKTLQGDLAVEASDCIKGKVTFRAPKKK